MDQPLIDRRCDERTARPLPTGARATLRPGCLVALVDLSPGGALVQGTRPLRPGAQVHLQVVIDARTFSLAAHVLRCAVWSLDPRDGITYRGALKFERRCELFWEPAAPSGCAVPVARTPAAGREGNHVPIAAASCSPSQDGAQE
ncbi:MAG: hypothetical protein A3H96_00165 [Acidobacteria bacterium RIFCSPLOWO2_02_FULL_67_36]|nr:MAG: hypothetical protein A3H96_00165 [Acidobacteria bacterium RIFCSPLOWO2_02_FULL_67_36]OFW19603.1 MAG: hypothetical protein A3G21_21605 [Acidobacteria bacterium RIFCSPLOWO2_12_FULL_66_21]